MGQSVVIAVFDTNIVIDALNGISKADKEYKLYERVIISRITWMEILVGEKENDKQLRDFLENQFEIADIDVNISELAVQLRRKYRLRLPDAIIWATAKAFGAVLVTRNTKDFDTKWDGIRVPYEV
jgi:predicted nucleic acid-binding protein